MKRRLTIARSLVNGPSCCCLTSPPPASIPRRATGVGPAVPAQAYGVTLVLTTHYMDEAEHLCDRLVVIDRGLVVAVGSPAELIASTPAARWWSCGSPPTAIASGGVLGRPGGASERVEVLPDRLLLYVGDGDALLDAIYARGLRPLSGLVRRSSLEDVFLHLTGRTLVD